jgi:hypothetical protein
LSRYRLVHFVPSSAPEARFPIGALVETAEDRVQFVKAPQPAQAHSLRDPQLLEVYRMALEVLPSTTAFDTLPRSLNALVSLGEPAQVSSPDPVGWVETRLFPEQDAHMYELARTVDEAIAACSGEEPLQPDDPRYVDLSDARGDDNARRLLRRRLTIRRDNGFAKIMFLSHRGSGKSTELLRLKGELEQVNRYRCLYLEANVEMDPNAIEGEDLLLALARAVEEFMRVREGLPLPMESLARVTSWFRDILRTTEWGRSSSVERGLGELPPLGALLANFNAITRHESRHRTEVRQAFQRVPGTLLDAINQIFDQANHLLHLHHRGELLVIIDNLDRYPPDVVDRLLLRGADRIHELHCNLMLTPPIHLHYRPPSVALGEHYICEIMSAIRLRGPKDPYDAPQDPGRKLLLDALGKRIHLPSLIPEVEARERLVLASGGAIRDLLKLVAAAALRAEGETITRKEVERAVALRRTEMRDQINANGWAAALAGIQQRKQIDENDACQAVLYHRLAFKYNGEGWYDIHPVVAEIEEVTRLQES